MINLKFDKTNRGDSARDAEVGVVVIRGPDYVEARPEGVNKGEAVDRLVQSLDRASRGKQHDFVLCIGDDLSDEAMYSALQVRFVSAAIALRSVSALSHVTFDVC